MWQPIETAPKDQTFLAVLNCAGQQTICTMRWAVAEEKNSRPDHYVFHVERVTHWMPLPDLPGAQPAPSLASNDVSLISEGKTQPAPSIPDGWLRAIDEALIVAHIGVANPSDTYEQAKAKLDNLIGFHVDAATDPAVNGGWKLVPRPPTPTMVKAGLGSSHVLNVHRVLACYDAMIDAAPEAKP